MSDYYSKAQAKRKAEQIVELYGQKILAATRNTGIDPAFVAGKTGVEAGVKNGKIVENATRFEPGVYQDLKDLRDKGFCFIGGKKMKTYSGVKRSQIADATDAALKALATSYGLTQIMGWHMINNLKGTISDLRDPDKHLSYNVQLLALVGGNYLKRKDYESVLRIWNTGRANGKTYHPYYVANALLVMEMAAPLLNKLKAQPQTITKPQTSKPAQSSSSSILDVIQAESQEFDDELTDDDVEQTDLTPAPVQNADQIINVNPEPAGDQNDNQSGEQPEPTDVPMDAPQPENLKSKINRWLAYFGIGLPAGGGILATISRIQENGFSLSDVITIMLQLFQFVFPYLAWIMVAYIVYRIIKMILVQISFIIRMKINGDPAQNNIRLIPGKNKEKNWLERCFNE